MTRSPVALLMLLLFSGGVSTATAQTGTAPTASTTMFTSAESQKQYGPLYQMEIKDQAAGDMFRDLKVVKKFARRLPNFYSQVISNAQRDKVYEIQAAYFEPIEMLSLRLERLKVERDAQIEAVLTAGQKAKVEALNKDSAERRAATRAANANAN